MFTEHRETLTRMLLVRGIAYSRCEEILQEAYLTAYENLSEKPEGESIEEWVKAITLQSSKKWFSLYGVPYDKVAYKLDTSSSQNGKTVEHVAELRDTSKLLVNALHSLPPTDRDVILLRYIHEIPESEIAERLQLTSGSVTQIIGNAFDFLRNNPNLKKAI
jgi:RNA polymerase sigma-70 factor (ECF subfamily)